jgi:predicted O-linked N-acetylglucosamine transferase (SPINDLY family)
MSAQDFFLHAQQAYNTGRREEAQTFCRRALGEQGDHAGAHQLLGVLLLESGDARAAASHFFEAAAREPNEPSIHQNHAMALLALGDAERAIVALDRAIALKSDYGMAYFNRANAQMQLGHFGDAIGNFERALKLGLRDHTLFYGLAHAHAALGQKNEALICYDRAIVMKHDFLEAVFNRALLLLEMNRCEEALSWFNRALVLNPRLTEAHVQRGVALSRVGRTEDAVKAFDQAIRQKPDHGLAMAHKGLMLHERERYGEALDAFDAAIAHQPDLLFLKGVRLFGMLNVCRWETFESDAADLIAEVEQGKALVEPFQLLCFPSTPAQQKTCAKRYAEQKFSAQPLTRLPAGHCGRLRIAYVSKDFRDHATAVLFTEVLEQHDRNAVEVFAFSHGPDDGSTARARVQNAVEHFDDVQGLDDWAIARRITDCGIDIAVDLDGYTAAARPGILSHRPAPVQASFLGYPGTLGAGHIDYLIADAVVAPFAHEAHYTEKLVHMPGSYQPNGARPEGPLPSRREAGLPETGFVFGAFNNNFKITPDVFASWMKILARVPGSILWLFARTDAAKHNLAREAGRQGVDPARLIFAPPVDLATHMARLPLIDLFLDTYIYGAHTTASDALWAGVPVVTKLGSSFTGRVAASLLSATGLAELITHSPEDYENLAVALAHEPARLARLKTHLKNGRTSFPLFDSAAFARDLEKAFAGMWARYQTGLAPESFAVAPAPNPVDSGLIGARA